MILRELPMMTTRALLTSILVAGMLSTLTGCNKQPASEDTRRFENPPPIPPNCPNLPELKNITLKDGAVANVRIVQFRDTKLYLPADIAEDQFIDTMRSRQSGFVEKQALGNFRPDIYSNECPGIVHHIADERRHLDGVYPMIGMQIAGLNQNHQFLSISPGFWALRYGLNPKVVSPHAKFVLGLNQKIQFNNDIIIQLVVGSTAVSGVAYESQSVLDLTKWLETPPAHRDNDKQFTLKIDRTIKL